MDNIELLQIALAKGLQLIMIPRKSHLVVTVLEMFYNVTYIQPFG